MPTHPNQTAKAGTESIGEITGIPVEMAETRNLKTESLVRMEKSSSMFLLSESFLTSMPLYEVKHFYGLCYIYRYSTSPMFLWVIETGSYCARVLAKAIIWLCWFLV